MLAGTLRIEIISIVAGAAIVVLQHNFIRWEMNVENLVKRIMCSASAFVSFLCTHQLHDANDTDN